jgi:competence protein ComEC
MAIYFGQLSLVSLAVNLLIVPAQSALMILGGVATLVAFALPQIAQVIYWLDLPLLSWTLGVTRTFAALPFAQVDFHLNVSVVALFYTIVIGWAVMQATKPQWWLALGRFAQARAVVMATLFAGLSTVALAGAVVLSRPDKLLHVWLLDMGESNAVLIQSPGGATMLVDGGRFPSRLLTAIGDRLPFNKREIDVVAITQPDENEFGALPGVLGRYETGLILTNGQPNQSEAFQQLQAAMAGRNVLAVKAGYTLDTDDGVHLEVLNPQAVPDLATSPDDAALVLRLSYGQVSFLLTSDLSKDGQAALLDGGQWFAASVIQLPQHGTARSLSEDFLRAVQPQMVVVQSDPANRRGDPDPDTLALVQKTLPDGTPLYRTDQGGTIHLWTDGQNLWELPEK